MLRNIGYVLEKLDWMRAERIWPNGLRYLWTDAFGVVLYISLYRELGESHWLDQAEQGSRRGACARPPARLRIGEAADRDGQYFHYLAKWLFALARLGELKPKYRERGIALARDVHPAFVIPDRGVIWKMKEDLSGPYPGYGLGAMDAYDGYVSYRLLDSDALAAEIAEMSALIEQRVLYALAQGSSEKKCASHSIMPQSIDEWPDRVERLNASLSNGVGATNMIARRLRG